MQAQPAWPPLNTEKPNEICRDGGGLVDLWENSPARIEDNDSDTEEIIDALFPHDALLCCGKSNSDFDTQSREQWRGQLRKLSLISAVADDGAARINARGQTLSACALDYDDGRAALGKVISKIFRNLESPIP